MVSSKSSKHAFPCRIKYIQICFANCASVWLNSFAYFKLSLGFIQHVSHMEDKTFFWIVTVEDICLKFSGMEFYGSWCLKFPYNAPKLICHVKIWEPKENSNISMCTWVCLSKRGFCYSPQGKDGPPLHSTLCNGAFFIFCCNLWFGGYKCPLLPVGPFFVSIFADRKSFRMLWWMKPKTYSPSKTEETMNRLTVFIRSGLRLTLLISQYFESYGLPRGLNILYWLSRQ